MLKDICINTDDTEQIVFVRKFLTDFRHENYNEYNKNTRFQFQAFSDVIMLLAEKLEDQNVDS